MLERRVGSANFFDDALGPIEVFPFSLQGPSFGRIADYISQIAGLVRKFDQSRAAGKELTHALSEAACVVRWVDSCRPKLRRPILKRQGQTVF